MQLYKYLKLKEGVRVSDHEISDHHRSLFALETCRLTFSSIFSPKVTSLT